MINTAYKLIKYYDSFCINFMSYSLIVLSEAYFAIFLLMALSVHQFEIGCLILFTLWVFFRLKVFYDDKKYAR